MNHRVMAAAILVGVSFLVASASAQERASSGESRSVLIRRPSEGAASDRVGSGLEGRGSAAERPAAPRSRFVDRLQSIRRNYSPENRETSSTARSSNSVVRPADSDPARRRAAAITSEPNLLPSRTAATASAGDDSGLPAALKRTPAPVTTMRDGSSARRLRDDASGLGNSVRSAPVTAGVGDRPSPQLWRDQSGGAASVAKADSSSSADDGKTTLLTKTGASLRVDTIGPDAIMIGREADYELILTNQSEIAANGVFVRVVVPAWVQVVMANASLGSAQVRKGEMGGQHLIWNADHLAAGEEQTLRLKVVPRENRPFHLAVDWTQRPTASVAEIFVQQPELQISVFGPRDIQYGETAVYTIQLSNPGTGPAEDVVVDFVYGSERLPTKELGELAAGEQTEIRVELSARQAGSLRVAAAAKAEGDLRSEAVEDVLVRRGKLEVQVDGSPVKFAGSVANYEIRIRNVGDAAATEVAAEIVLPGGAKYMSQEEGVDVVGNILTRQLGTIAPGSERVFRIACQLTSAGDNTLEAKTRGSSDLLAIDTFVTQVRALADLKLVVNDPQGPTAVGADAIFEVEIANRGTKAARDVRVIAQFSDGIEPVEAIGARTVPGQVLFKPIGRIEPGEQVRLKIVARADKEGNHRFRTEVKCADPETLLVAEESTYFFGDGVSAARTDRSIR